MKTVLLPVKDFKLAKQRLAGALDAPRRAGLARAMLRDVVRSLAEARRPDRVVVYTASEAVAEVVRPYAFDIVEELLVSGHSSAVNRMVDDLAARSSHILSIAADLPTLTAADVDRIFEIGSAPINLVASRDGTGTNAALFVLPARIRMEYGEGSLSRHLARAAEAGLKTDVLKIPGIEFDLDTPDDLAAYLQRAPDSSATWQFLR
jgi:2-phospho-L-lactate/phosphoenolpyruvate guanylyltransferase